jgi:hypothetical protein
MVQRGGFSVLGACTCFGLACKGFPCEVKIVLVPGGFVDNGDGYGLQRVKKGYSEVELEERNKNMQRGREKIGSSDGDIIHLGCMVSETRSSSTRQGETEGVSPISGWLR